MSGAATAAQVQAVFRLSGEDRRVLADRAAELIERLQELALTPDCDVDVDVRWEENR